MKKILVFIFAVFGIVGCSSMEHHNGKNSVIMQNVVVEPKPMQADIKVDKKITGVAECEKWFGFYTKKPQNQTYGAELQVASGNFAASPCTRGALYDALNKNNADVIVAPHYSSVKTQDMCILGLCLHTIDKIIITGYKGTVENISPMEHSVVLERQKHGVNTDTNHTKRIGLF